MARGTITAQLTTRAGLNATYTAGSTANGHQFINTDERAFLHVKNGGAGTTVITITTSVTVDGFAVPDRTVSIPAGEDRFIGAFKNAQYGNAISGVQYVYVDMDVDTSVTLAVLKQGSPN